MYACGPTVYARQHIGNFRAYIAEDILKRAFHMNGFRVQHVMNITDVGHLTSDADTGEDKMEASARREKKKAVDIAKEITELFFSDAAKLNITAPDTVAKATEHIQEQIALIQTLEQKGCTYRTDDGIYFDTASFPEYGKLSTLTKKGLREGARVEKNPQKRHPTDFALWKFSPQGQQRQLEWPSPWGVGFPGWHIECSAMAMKYLGETLDIHCGGIDHLSIHHPNEIAQSEAATGKPFSRFWFHVAFLNVQEKMSKSLGNVITLDDILTRSIDPLSFRYLCLTTHYRKPIAFTWESLQAAQGALNSLIAKLQTWDEPRVGCAELEAHFREAINDDLNTPKALAVLWETVQSDYPPSAKRESINVFDAVLGLGLNAVVRPSVPTEIQRLLAERETARKAGNFDLADSLRAQIEDAGFSLDDTPDGPVVRKNTSP